MILTATWSYYLINYWYFLKNYPGRFDYRTNLKFIFTTTNTSAYQQSWKKLTSTDSIKYKFKTLNRLTYQGFRDKHFTRTEGLNSKSKHSSFVLYKVFLITCVQNPKLHARIHPTARTYFLDDRRSAGGIFNPTRLFRRWQDFYLLLFNLFFYKINMLYFGNRVFKRQVLALNWLALNKFTYIWSFAQPYLYHRINALDAAATHTFQYLLARNFHTAFVFDSTFHHKTLHYLHKWGFYTIGSVSITHDMNTINFALPVAADSLTMHLFCLRLVSHIKRFSEGYHFQDYQNYWALR